MKNFKLTETTTLFPPDQRGDVAIQVEKLKKYTVEFVSFLELETWVASISKQIITVATSQEPCVNCGFYTNVYGYHFCPACGLALD